MLSIRRIVILASSVALFATLVPCQCATAWQMGNGVPGVAGGTMGEVLGATAWDPDGPGPATARVAIAGRFAMAGSVDARGVAAWDPATGLWEALGSGVAGGSSVLAISAQSNGGLVVAGDFLAAGGVAANRIARWNGSQWSPLGAGLDGPVLALLALPNGDLVAGGFFTTAGGVPTSGVARWNGTSWSSVGGGLNGAVRGLCQLPNGDVIAVGSFTVAGTVAVNNIARWNGTTWSALGAGISGAPFAVAAMPNGDVIAAGASVPAAPAAVGRARCRP